MSGRTTIELIEELRSVAAQLWARQAHEALGLPWEAFLADQGVLSPETILPAAVPRHEADPVPLPFAEEGPK